MQLSLLQREARQSVFRLTYFLEHYVSVPFFHCFSFMTFKFLGEFFQTLNRHFALLQAMMDLSAAQVIADESLSKENNMSRLAEEAQAIAAECVLFCVITQYLVICVLYF